jgi:hypothetical protein
MPMQAFSDESMSRMAFQQPIHYRPLTQAYEQVLSHAIPMATGLLPQSTAGEQLQWQRATQVNAPLGPNIDLDRFPTISMQTPLVNMTNNASQPQFVFMTDQRQGMEEMHDDRPRSVHSLPCSVAGSITISSGASEAAGAVSTPAFTGGMAGDLLVPVATVKAVGRNVSADADKDIKRIRNRDSARRARRRKLERLQELEARVAELETENDDLKTANETLRSEKANIKFKFDAVMQKWCDEKGVATQREGS